MGGRQADSCESARGTGWARANEARGSAGPLKRRGHCVTGSAPKSCPSFEMEARSCAWVGQTSRTPPRELQLLLRYCRGRFLCTAPQAEEKGVSGDSSDRTTLGPPKVTTRGERVTLSKSAEVRRCRHPCAGDPRTIDSAWPQCGHRGSRIAGDIGQTVSTDARCLRALHPYFLLLPFVIVAESQRVTVVAPRVDTVAFRVTTCI